MKRILNLVLSILILLKLFHGGNLNAQGTYYFPPEWEKHEAIWIDWTNLPVDDTKIQMIKALHKHVKVKLLTHADSLRVNAIKMMLEANIDTSRIEIFFHKTPNYFIRDAGPKYLTNGEQLLIADFGWDCFGNAPYGKDCYTRGEIENDLATQFKIPVKSTMIVTEGGALEVNSSVIIAFKEMAIMRNRNKDINEIEKAFLDMYGKEKIIWIDRIPILDLAGVKVDNFVGQGANGHIDEYMRFVNDSTILVAVIDSSEMEANPINKIDYHILNTNLRQIKNSKDENGKLFNIVTMPVPDVSLYAIKSPLTKKTKERYQEWYKDFKVGDTIINVPIMSYMNFTISNGVVLIHKYWHEGIPESEKLKDEMAFNTIQKYFPDRKVIQINALPLNWYGGGIHCSTQQEPAIN